MDAVSSFDSYRYVDLLTRKVMQAWAERDLRNKPSPMPWSPLRKPLSQAKVALLSTAAVARTDDVPFDTDGERRNPWWGDPSFRRIPRGTRTNQVGIHHLHIDRSHARADLNVVLPLDRLDELAAEGFIGQSAAMHYSMMGYILDARELLTNTVPAIIQHLREDEVDVVVLVPS